MTDAHPPVCADDASADWLSSPSLSLPMIVMEVSKLIITFYFTDIYVVSTGVSTVVNFNFLQVRNIESLCPPPPSSSDSIMSAPCPLI